MLHERVLYDAQEASGGRLDAHLLANLAHKRLAASLAEFDVSAWQIRSLCAFCAAKKQLARLTELGFDRLPVCIAKTQYSFTDDPTKLGAPEDFTVTVKNVKVSAGAGFIVVLTGDIMTMPGLPKKPAAENIDVTDEGKISGLF